VQQVVDRLLVEADASPETALRVGAGTVEQRPDVVVGERLQADQLAARQQRAR
jgi:hypothetical protein